MAAPYVCKVTTSTVDLAKKKHLFAIEEPGDIFFFQSDMKVECISLDSGESKFNTKPGKIKDNNRPKTSTRGKQSVVEYTPDVKTMPGKYKLHVVFKSKQKSGQYAKIGTISVEFKVIDTTPLAFVSGKNKVNCLIDLNKSRNPGGRRPVTLYLEGPRNMPVRLELCYTRDEIDNPLTIRNPMFAGTFSKTTLKLSGAGKRDEVYCYPGLSPRSGKVVATAYFGKTHKKLQFTLIYSDVKCGVFLNNSKIPENLTIIVGLRHSLGTALRSYRTTLSGMFSFVGPGESRVEIKMNWNGSQFGHSHNLASDNELATGAFSNFTKRGNHWVPNDSLVNKDGTVNYRDIDYLCYGMSGNVKVVVSFKNMENIPIESKTFHLSVMYPNLKKLEAGAEDNIKLVGDNKIHPDNHYGTHELIDAIKAIAKAYGEAYDRREFHDKNGNKPKYKELYVNDMSLRFGGRFDCSHREGTVATNPFMPGHEEHMFGEEVDIQTKEMNAKQRAWFDNNATLNGFVRCDPEPKNSSNPHHFHCSVVRA